jgi:hypothetical protein
MSNDIFDERESMQSAQEIASKLRVMYNESIGPPVVGDHVDVDVRIRRTKLGLVKCDDSLLAQMVLDVCEVLNQYNVDPRSVRW